VAGSRHSASVNFWPAWTRTGARPSSRHGCGTGRSPSICASTSPVSPPTSLSTSTSSTARTVTARISHSSTSPCSSARRACFLCTTGSFRGTSATSTASCSPPSGSLSQGELVPEHEEFYKWYFTVRETPKRGRLITINVEAAKEHQNKYCGYYAILTNDVKDPVLALRIYRDKDAVEKCFDDLKNQLDMKRLRTHGRFSGRYGKLLTETIKVQREMMESLGVPAETWLQK
jgi:hypothetical protein